MIVKLSEGKRMYQRAMYCKLRVNGEVCGGRITYAVHGPAVNKKADVRCSKCGSDLSLRDAPNA